ncbi:aminotransferase class IV family protein [Luteimonas aquatica]|uniref:aminotransferase class IV family protein n=1 Tax=Luteimonas aquatica TaxID=450364 RepID=UPI001F59407C|nr:aminotransferase class IV family protein [Luteimonas aquatica]
MTAMFCNGLPATSEDLRALALRNYGHFTVMQVRGGAAQGLHAHLARLQAATRELFGAELEAGRIVAELRHALAAAGMGDCSVRITVFSREFDIDDPARAIGLDVLIALAPPSTAGGAPLRVKSYRHERTLPHIKHAGTLPLFHFRRQARLAGYDDALFVDAAGRISEGSIWNVGFWDGARVVWPQAPALHGIMQQLLEAGLRETGVAQVRREIGLGDLPGFQAAFASYSRGIHPLAAVDGVAFEGGAGLPERLARALATQPWEPV